MTRGARVHGGPWARDKWGYDPLAQWLANRGYAVLQVNFRSSTGYGKKFDPAVKSSVLRQYRVFIFSLVKNIVL